MHVHDTHWLTSLLPRASGVVLTSLRYRIRNFFASRKESWSEAVAAVEQIHVHVVCTLYMYIYCACTCTCMCIISCHGKYGVRGLVFLQFVFICVCACKASVQCSYCTTCTTSPTCMSYMYMHSPRACMEGRPWRFPADGWNVDSCGSRPSKSTITYAREGKKRN